MKSANAILLPALVLAAATLPNYTLAQTISGAPLPASWQIVEGGPNHRVWRQENYDVTPDGQVVTNFHSFTELATGLEYLDSQSGQWLESQELIEPCSIGAVARRGQTQVIFANNLNTAGAIDFSGPDRQRLRSNILGLGYFDRASGQGVVFAVLKDSYGQLISANRVLYTNAFDGIAASVEYVYKRGSFLQDVILESQLPDPEAFGLSSASSQLEVFSEFLSSLPATVTTDISGGDVDQTVTWGATQIGRGRAFAVSEDGDSSGVSVSKLYLDVQGRKILVEAVPLRTIAAALSQLPLQSSAATYRTTLLASQADMVPAPVKKQEANPQPMKLAQASSTHGGTGLAVGPGARQRVPTGSGTARSFVLDYNAMNASLTNFTFQGDTTYYVSGPVNLAGTTRIEGGAVIKFGTNDSSLNVLDTVSCLTAPYLPAVFTSVNDASVGENFSASSHGPPWETTGVLRVRNDWNQDLQDVMVYYYDYWGSEYPLYDMSGPAIRSGQARDYFCYVNGETEFYFDAYDGNGKEFSGGFYPQSGNGAIEVDSSGNVTYTDLGGASVALSLANGGALHDLRICNAGAGITSWADYSVTNVQFVNCGVAMNTVNASFYAGNVLMSRVGTAFNGQNGYGQSFQGQVEQLTYDQGSHVTDDLQITEPGGGVPNGECVNITNSIITGVTDFGPVPVNTNYVVNLPSGSGVYQPAGAGSYYLGTNYNNAGTTNISTSLLAQLAKKTTYAPVICSNKTFSAATNFAPQAPRDNVGNPGLGLGYHYDALDYLLGNVVAQSNVTFAAGTAVGYYNWMGNTNGIAVGDSATVAFNGTVTSPCRWARNNTVQEGVTNGYTAQNWLGGITGQAYSSVAPAITEQFTMNSELAAQGNVIREYGSQMAVLAKNCEFWSGSASFGKSSVIFTNCLFVNTAPSFSGFTTGNLAMDNCTAIRGYFYVYKTYGGTWGLSILNSAFDKTKIYMACVPTNGYYADYNSFLLNSNRLLFVGPHDVIVTNSYNWQSSWLGNYYQTNNSRLIDKGSTTADQVGLYEFTTQTSQSKETNSTVDIGYHYVAVDQYGNPIDTYLTGTPDYLVDTAGNGMDTNGLPYWWEAKYFGYLGVNPTNDADYDGIANYQEWLNGTDPTDPNSAPGIMLSYWRFNSPSLTNEAGLAPTSKDIATTLPDWSGTSVYLQQGKGRLTYPESGTNGNAIVNCRNGTVRFWFNPHWTSKSLGGEGAPGCPGFFDFGTSSGNYWDLEINDSQGITNFIEFKTRSNGVGGVYYYESYFRVPLQFNSNLWYQLTLTYTPTNIAFYTNGILAATSLQLSDGNHGYPWSSDSVWFGNDAGAGIYNYPPESVRSIGFSIGSYYDDNQDLQINGEFDEFQTFNYALTAQQVAQGFPGFNGATNVMQDSDYDGRSDLLEQYADGTVPNNYDDAVPTRLGYWRFNDATNVGEMGQLPLSSVDISNTPDWSGKSLVISSASDSRLTYRDVETNGWANFNCRKGSVRFWFKPNWSAGSKPGGYAPFLSMGTTTMTYDYWFLYATTLGNQIGFAMNTPSVNTTFFEVPWSFNISNWCQIVFNYSPTNLALYVNGTLLTNVTVSSWSWPALSSRTNGLIIGNWPSYPVSSINGQFDELETFNYNLDANEITRNFQAVKSVDSDLNGVADLLEELILTNNVPFMGVPFPVTGVFEAEQFDVGGTNRGYSALDSAYATTNYRVSALDITNCDDLGGGFCVDKLRAGEWLKYTMDVSVSQTYAVEARVKGIGSNGLFMIAFYTNGVMYAAMTNNLTPLGTNWMNLTFKNIWLAAGTNVMKVTMLTNGLVYGVRGNYVMKFNYTSIYPSWNEGVTNILYTNSNLSNLLVPNRCDWGTANGNAVAIQNVIDDVAAHVTATQGGMVSIPAGTYYVASREVTDETQNAEHNTAEFIYRNNIVVQGAGKTNTILVAHNRAVTLFYIGRIAYPDLSQAAVTNCVLQDLTLEGSPHWVYDATNTNQRTWEEGAFKPSHPDDTGCLMVGLGMGPNQPLNNVLVANCLFKNSPIHDIVLPGAVTDFLSISNDFLFRADGTNGGYSGSITATNSTTTNWPVNGIGIFVPAGGAVNLNLIACSFNGHVNPTNTDPSWVADGVLFCQVAWQYVGTNFVGRATGNWFAARNTITNYGLEGIQWGNGPAAVVQNSFATYASTYSTCALCNQIPWYSTGPSGRPTDLSFAFVGNTVLGGQQGVFSVDWDPSGETNIANLLVSGNSFNLYLTNPDSTDWPGAAGMLWWVDKLDASGNTLSGGEQGIAIQYALTNAVILGNDFTAANLRSVDTEDLGKNVVGAIQSAQLIKNKLAGGESFQVRAPFQDGTHYFLLQNQYVTTNGVPTGLVSEPQSLPVHCQP